MLNGPFSACVCVRVCVCVCVWCNCTSIIWREAKVRAEVGGGGVNSGGPWTGLNSDRRVWSLPWRCGHHGRIGDRKQILKCELERWKVEGELEMGVWVWSSELREVMGGIQVWLWVDSVDGEDIRGQRGPGDWTLLLCDWIRDVSRGVECDLQRCPQRTAEPRGQGVRRAGEFCKVLFTPTRKHNSSSWAQRAGFTSPSDRPLSVKSRLYLCPLEGKHVSHFCLFKASFDVACCYPLQPMETQG